MSHPAPKVYIDDLLMDSYALEDMPVLAGLGIKFGVQADMDMQEVESLALEILIREPADTAFLDLGKIVAVVHEPTGTESAFTYFVGRIQRLEGRPDPSVPGGLRISIQASDLTADLANETVYNVASGAATGTTRMGNMNYWAPDGWTVNNFPLRFPDRMHAQMVYKQKPFLELLDQFLRAQIMVRTNRSRYVPGSGVVKQLTALQDSSRDTAPDKLGIYSDGSGRWGVVAGTPAAAGYVTVRQYARNILADAGWTKEPEDVITEVALQRVDTWDGKSDTGTTPVTSRAHVDTTASRLAFGVRSLEFDTDLPAGGAAAEIVPLFNHWLSTESKWRAKTLTFRDTAVMSITELSYLMAPTSRQTAFLVVRDPLDNRPDRGTSDIRGVVIGGDATWTGKKWELTVTLGRVPGLPVAGDFYTCENIGTVSAGYFAAGACDTVGDELSCSDFLRIGAP